MMLRHHPYSPSAQLAILLGIQHRPAANDPQVRPQRFEISATKADGTTTRWSALGGTSIQHTLDAMDVAGLGGVVRVLPMRQAEALPC